MTRTAALAPVLAGHIAAVNAFDQDAIVANFTGDPWSTTCTGKSGAARPSAAGCLPCLR